MDQVLDRCRALGFFQALDEATLTEVSQRGRWFSLAGGKSLFEAASPSHAMYFVLSGRLIVVRHGEDGDEVIGYVRSGEPVGEMSLLSGEPHSASVYALRDTELLALDRHVFEDLFETEADLAGALARSMLARARNPAASFQQSAPRVFALIAPSPSIDVEGYGRRLAQKINALGQTVKQVDERDAETFVYTEFDDLENRHDVTLLTGRVGDSAWYRFLLRHADRFFVFARLDSRPPDPFPLAVGQETPARRFRLVDLVMVHEGARQARTAMWADAINANRIFHVSNEDGVSRLGRAIASASVALVLSGGGARGYAHIGVVRAIRAAGMPVDFACGASMGAIIAACVAMGWKNEEIEARIRDAFVVSNPLGDHVLPVVALTRGRLVEERLKRHFGDTLIEDMPIPFFCVSSDLTDGSAYIHRRGLLRDALRASIALPGILPPVVFEDRLLVDGAVVNNFPTDLVADLHRGVTLGVDVARTGTIDPSEFVDPPGFFRWIFDNGLSSAPPIVSLLMRSATARHEQSRRSHPADIMVTPAVPGVGLRDWKKFEEAISAGEAAAQDVLARHAPSIDRHFLR